MMLCLERRNKTVMHLVTIVHSAYRTILPPRLEGPAIEAHLTVVNQDKKL